MATSGWRGKGADGHYHDNFTSYNGGDQTAISGNPATIYYATYSSSTVTEIASTDKLLSVTVALNAARHSNTSGVTDWYWRVGYDNSYKHSTTYTGDRGTYASGSYSWHTWDSEVSTIKITDSGLLGKMKSHSNIQLWWDSGVGDIGANSYIKVIAKELATVSDAPTFNYPYENATTYNSQPWISIKAVNKSLAVSPGTLQVSTNNSNWYDVSTTASGTTLTYTGAIPAGAKFTTTGVKKIYIRCSNNVGVSTVTTRNITYSNIGAPVAGDKILHDNHLTRLYAAIPYYLRYYYTGNSTADTSQAGDKITAALITNLNTQLNGLPPKKSISVTQGSIITAAQYANFIAAIKSS